MLEQVTSLVLYFVTVSVAAERMTEIFKRTFIQDSTRFPKLNGGVYQIISAVFGSVVAYSSPPDLEFLHLDPYVTIVLTGLAVSGGSGAWNSVLDFLKQITVVKAEPAKQD
jgi:hypothetical protein